MGAARMVAGRISTLASVAPLSGDALFRTLGTEQRRRLLHDESAQTAVERGDGLIPAVRVKSGGQRLPALQQLTETFDECIGPAKLEANTRGSYQAAWRTVLTWGIAHDSVHLLLTMTRATLKALTLELLMVGCAAGTVKNVWSSVEDRHRRFGLPLPLGVSGDFRRLYKAVCAVHRAPSRICFPIGPHHVKQLLDLVGLTGVQLRDVLMCVTGVVLSRTLRGQDTTHASVWRHTTSGTSCSGSGGMLSSMDSGSARSARKGRARGRAAGSAPHFFSPKREKRRRQRGQALEILEFLLVGGVVPAVTRSRLRARQFFHGKIRA